MTNTTKKVNKKEKESPPKKTFIEMLFNNNITPIAVALISVFGTYKILEYRVTELEKSRSNSPNFSVLEERLNNFITTQQGINKLILKHLMHEDYESSVSKESTKLQAKDLMMQVRETDKKLNILNKDKK